MRRLGCNDVVWPKQQLTRCSPAVNLMASGASLPLKPATPDKEFHVPFCPVALAKDTEEPSPLHEAMG